MVTTKIIARGTELKAIDFGPVLNKINALFEDEDEFLVIDEDEFDILCAWEGLKLSEDVFVFRKVF